jgi:hypothetical protein
MLTSIDCNSCRSSHFDHYECGECNYKFGFCKPLANYCPNCGERLVSRLVDLVKRQAKKP